MPTRNTKLYNQENLNKIKKLRSQGYMLHEIDVYLECHVEPLPITFAKLEGR